MTIGKLYYIANVLGALDEFFGIAAVVVMIIGASISIVFFIVNDGCYDDDDMAQVKKLLKILWLFPLGASLLSALIPSKEDFLIIALTKDYRPEQVYKMTKDELKSGIDYVMERLKEVEE